MSAQIVTPPVEPSHVESVCTFGSDHRLVGTLCQPQSGAPKEVAFIMLNAGVVSRMGPHRFNVKLARHLAERGFVSLRFDLSGQGDSRPASGVHSQEEQVMVDLREALDGVSHQTGIRRFVIAGICSGAVAAYYFAQRDPRVVGTWMLDGYTFHTWQSHVRRYGGKLMRALKGLLFNGRATLQRLFDALKLNALGKGQETVDYGSNRHPTQAEYVAAMQKLADRGARHFMMFSGDIHWYYNYSGQFHDAFGRHAFAQGVTVEYMPTIDHTLTRLNAQQHVITRIGTWACTFANPPSR